MKVAIFGKQITSESSPYIEELHSILVKDDIEILVYQPLADFIDQHCDIDYSFFTFSTTKDLHQARPDFVFTLGGDGTILEAATFVENSGIPILGINTGRLGFLANVAKENMAQAVKSLKAGNYTIKNRAMLQVNVDGEEQPLAPNFALNEVAVSRSATTSMITVKAYIDGEYLNAYWSDGLIIATPTGSTGYSLSCGGPIIMPGCDNFVITPISPHNFNVRPFVISNKSKITLEVESRESNFLLSLDSRLHSIPVGTKIHIEKSPHQLKLVETEIQDFPSTLRNKLLWGLDRRNS